MNQAVYYSTKLAFKALIGNCRFIQRKFYENQAHTRYGIQHFAALTCCVSIGGPRRSGKTWACNELMFDDAWFRNGIYLASNDNSAHHVWRDFGCKISPNAKNERHRYHSIQSEKIRGFRDEECEGVFADCCGFNDEEAQKRLFSIFTPVLEKRLDAGKTFCFVFFT